MSGAPPAPDAGAKRRTSPFGDALIRLAIAALKLLARLPYPLFRPIGEAVGSLLWVVARPRRRVTLINLRLCMPALSEQERHRLGRRHFQYFARSFFDRFIVWFGTEQRIRQLVSLEGFEHLAPYRGKPVILLAPHFCGIDAGGLRLQLDVEACSMYANQKSELLSEVMTQGRSRFNGARMYLRNDGLRPVIRELRNGVPFYFLPDMDLGPRDAIFVPFFGVPAATVTSVARLARITGTTTDGYRMRMYPAWTDYPVDDLPAATRWMNAFIEDRVREMPAQYLWSHKRFKTRPPGEPGFYR